MLCSYLHDLCSPSRPMYSHDHELGRGVHVFESILTETSKLAARGAPVDIAYERCVLVAEAEIHVRLQAYSIEVGHCVKPTGEVQNLRARTAPTLLIPEVQQPRDGRRGPAACGGHRGL